MKDKPPGHVVSSIQTCNLELICHTPREKGAVWALRGFRLPVRFGPPDAVNAEVLIPELSKLGEEDLEEVKEVILQYLCGLPRLPLTPETIELLQAALLCKTNPGDRGQCEPPSWHGEVIHAAESWVRSGCPDLESPQKRSMEARKEEYPVTVWESEVGEFVLMLTSRMSNKLLPLPLHMFGEEPLEIEVSPVYTTRDSPTRIQVSRGSYFVQEPVEDIRRTIQMLKKPQT